MLGFWYVLAFLSVREIAYWINAVLEIENIAFLICHPDIRWDIFKIVTAFAIEFFI